jgi:serine/threonine protein kinase
VNNIRVCCLLYSAHAEQVDLWSIGVMLYEMLFNFAPFHGRNQMEVLSNMKSLKWNRPVSPAMRASITPSTWDLLMVLLKPVPRERITWNALVSHPFVDRTDLVTLDIPHPPSIQEETESEFSPMTSPIKSLQSPAEAIPAAVAACVDVASTRSAEHDDAAHLPVETLASLSSSAAGGYHATASHQRVRSSEKLAIPIGPSSDNLKRVPSTENLGHV